MQSISSPGNFTLILNSLQEGDYDYSVELDYNDNKGNSKKEPFSLDNNNITETEDQGEVIVFFVSAITIITVFVIIMSSIIITSSSLS